MKKYLLLLFALSIFACSGGVMNESRFTKIYIDSLSKAHPEMEFIASGYLEVEAKSGDVSATIFLDNAYREYAMDHKNAREIISRYIKSNSSSLESMADESSVQLSKIMPAVRSNDFLNTLIELNGKDDILYEQYNEDLVVLFVEDTESAMSYLSKASIEDLDISTDTLLNFALNNFKENLPELKTHGDGPSYMITADGNYEASLILLSDLWNKHNYNLDGDIVIAIPNRDLLLFTGSKNADGISKLKELSKKQYEEGSHSVSPNIYKWNGSKFERSK